MPAFKCGHTKTTTTMSNSGGGGSSNAGGGRGRGGGRSRGGGRGRGGAGGGRGRGRGSGGAGAGGNSGRGRGRGGSVGGGRGGRGTQQQASSGRGGQPPKQQGSSQQQPPKNRGKSSSPVPPSSRGGAGGGPGNTHRSRSTTPTTGAKKLQNGEKGADSHTVSESERIRFTKILMDLREGSETRLEFPSTLTNTERKFIHELASQLGLVSKSTGKGDNRRIAVTKRNDNSGKRAGNGDDEEDLNSIPTLQVGKAGKQALDRHMKLYPPTHTEELESYETGASLVEAFTQAASHVSNDENDTNNNDMTLVAALNQLGLGVQNDAKLDLSKKQRYVNLEQRRQRHSTIQQSKQSPSNLHSYQQMLQRRKQLPAYKHMADIVEIVANNSVTIIQGDTGCGKSTQVPQFLLDANPTCNIIVTQPRRISAISIAERVHQEQCIPNEDIGGMIGYQVRLEAAISHNTQLQFVTPGILLRKLQSSPTLHEYTHVILDEVHERDKYTEFLLIALRDLIETGTRPDLRLVLMSATIQVDKLIRYFYTSASTSQQQLDSIPNGGKYDEYEDYDDDDAGDGQFADAESDDAGDDIIMTDGATMSRNRDNPPAVIEMEGRTYPVQEFFLEHVLQMTGFIDVTTPMPDPNNQSTAAVEVSAQQLDKEIALLLMQQQQQSQQQAEIVRPPPSAGTFDCVLCGRRGFGDAIELGAHVAICDGNPVNESVTHQNGTALSYCDDDDDAGDQIIATPADETTSKVSFDEFDDYDVDDNAVLDGYDTFFESDTNKVELPEVEDETKKWDGTSPFEITAANDALLSATEEEILTRYQSMHDDEQVDDMLLLEVLHYIVQSSTKTGAILIFFPGWQEISEFNLLLEGTPPFSNRKQYLVLPLHSGIPSRDQRKVLQRPPTGIRKIILSTNIAETSLTIDDVAFVVDTGREKEKDYDPHLKTSTLQPTWISQASSKQRKGRAGRTKAGVCFHLFSSRRYASMRAFVESELLRTPLEEMCLLCKKLGLASGGSEDADGIPAFLSKAMSTPHPKSVSNALELLVDLGAMQPVTNDLTDLGQCLSIMSLEPRVGKMVIWSYLLGCARAASNMAVAMSYKSPFVLPPPHMRRAASQAMVELSRESESDQITVMNVIQKRDQLYQRPGEYNSFCRKNFLNFGTMEMISDLRKNLKRELATVGFPDPASIGANQYHNRHNNDHALWQAAVVAGLYPNVAFRRTGDVNFSTMANRKAKIHVSSVNSVKGQPLNAKCQVPKGEVEFVCFGELVKGTHFFTMSQTTHLSSPLPLLLLCGTSLSVRPQSGDGNFAILNVDDWIVFKTDSKTASHIVILRKRLDSAFWRAMSNPSEGVKRLTEVERNAIDILGKVLQSAHRSSANR